MITVKGIDHVCLWVRSLSEAKDYYERVFNFDCFYRDTEQDTLIVESNTVHFFLNEEDQDTQLLSKQHISFKVDSLDQIIDSLKKLGITQYTTGSVNCFKHENYRWCEWRDPSGIRLECIEVV